MVENSGLVVGQLNYNHRYPSIFHPFGLRDQKWRWYSHRIMQRVLVWPSRLFNYQFLIAAHLP
jgi:hypothetical protein